MRNTKQNINDRVKNLPKFIRSEKFAKLFSFLTPPNPVSIGMQLEIIKKRMPKRMRL